MKRYSALLLALLSACVPYPHFRLLMEKQSGTITMHGAPLAGLTVKQSYSFNDRTCAETVETTRTDQRGNFEFPAHSTFTFVATLSDDHHFSSLCTEYQGKPYWLLFTHTTGGAQRKESRYVCELEEKKVEKKEKSDKFWEDKGDGKRMTVAFPCTLVEHGKKP